MGSTQPRREFDWSVTRQLLINTCVSIACMIPLGLFSNSLADPSGTLPGSIVMTLGILGSIVVCLLYLRKTITNAWTCVQMAHLLY